MDFNQKTSVKRFSSPTILTDETIVLGVSVKIWNQVFTGQIERTFEKLKDWKRANFTAHE